MAGPETFNPAVLKPSMKTSGGDLKPSLVTSAYSGGTPGAGDLKPSLLKSDGDLKESLLSGGSLKAVLGGFTIASLFASATDGFWFDTSDASTLFQDSGGTTPVSSNEDPVGLVSDKSGFSNDATATGTARPTWDQANGRLVFDGVDAELVLHATVDSFVNKTDDHSFACWFVPAVVVGGQGIFNVSSAANDRVGINSSGTTLQAGLYNGTAYVGKRQTSAVSLDTAVHVGYRLASGAVTLFVNGVATSTSSEMGNLGTNDSIGLSNNGTWRVNGAIGHMIALDYALSDSQFAQLAAV